MKETLYRKVEIKTEADLPKEDGDYIVHSKSFGWIGLAIWKTFENANYPEYNQYLWLLNYDWYLQPIEPQEPKVVYTLTCNKCEKAYSSADAFPEDQLCNKCFAEKYLRHHFQSKEHTKTAELGRLKFSDVVEIIKIVDTNDVIGNHGAVYEVVCIALEEYASQSQSKEISVTDEEIETEAIKRSTWTIAGVKSWDQTDNALKNRLIDMAKWMRDKLKANG